MLLRTSLFDKPSTSSVSLNIPSSSPRFRHPSRLKMTATEYLCDISQKMKGQNANLSIILAKVNQDCLEKSNRLSQFAKVMRSLVQGVDDFVGFGQDNTVIAILPQTNLGEAVQVLYQIHDFYGETVEKLEVISTNLQQESIIQPLLTKIQGDLYQFN